jgi:hypothetical protein
MKKKITLITFVMGFLMLSNSIKAVDGYIMLVGSNENDSSVVKLLTDAGYTVKRGLNYTGILDQARLDSLNNARLVIFSRNGATTGYGDESSTAGIVQQWADVSAPILSLSIWIMRSSRWQWINNTTTACLESDTIFPTDEGLQHPIFSNIKLNNGGVSFTDTGVTRNESTPINDDLTTGAYLKILATDSRGDSKRIAIAEWEAGVPFYDGAPSPSSTRMFIAITQGDNCKVGDNHQAEFNGTETGKKIFLNAVAYLMGIPIEGGVAVKNIAVNNSLNIFPNPASQTITLSNLKSLVDFRIINVNGAVVLKGKTTGNINISSLTSGLYMLVTDNGLNGKFMKK